MIENRYVWVSKLSYNDARRWGISLTPPWVGIFPPS